jgi:hypothetical protein
VDPVPGKDPEEVPEAGLPTPVEWPIRLATVLCLVGLGLTLSFMIFGFGPVTIGLGVFLGGPLLLAAMVLYLYAVVRDLRRRDIL